MIKYLSMSNIDVGDKVSIIATNRRYRLIGDYTVVKKNKLTAHLQRESDGDEFLWSVKRNEPKNTKHNYMMYRIVSVEDGHAVRDEHTRTIAIKSAWVSCEHAVNARSIESLEESIALLKSLM